MIAALRAAGFATQVPFATADIQARYCAERADGLQARNGPSRIIGAHTSTDGAAWFDII